MGRLTIASVVLLTLSSLALADTGKKVSDSSTGVQFSEKQRIQYEQCLTAVERLRAEVRALSITPPRPEPAITTYAKHRREIRLAAISVRKCHSRLSDSFSQEQRTVLKRDLDQLKNTWSGVQRHLLTLDDDLNQHLLDNGRLMLHVQELERFVDEYHEWYRKLGSDTAAVRQSSSPQTKTRELSFVLAASEPMKLAALTYLDQV